MLNKVRSSRGLKVRLDEVRSSDRGIRVDHEVVSLGSSEGNGPVGAWV